MVKYCWFLYVMMLSFPLFGQILDTMNSKQAIVLSWEAIPATYRIDIRQEGLVFYTTEIDSNELRLELAQGFYEYQVTFIDPFGSIISKSGWQKLEVQYVHPPYFRVIEPVESWVGTTGIELRIDSTSLKPGTQFTLINNEEEVSIVGLKQKNTIKFSIDASNLSPGTWGLLARSSTGSTYLSPEVLRLRESKPPQIDQIHTQGLMDAGLATIEINGSNFEKDMTIRITDYQNDLPITDINVITENMAIINLEIEESVLGNYSIIITNPSGGETSRDNAFVIKRNKALQQSLFGFQSGYAPMATFIPDNSNTQIVPGIIGIETAIQFNPRTKKSFLRSFGLEIHGMIGFNGPNKAFGPFDMMGMVDIALNWQPEFNGRVSPLVQFGVGNMWFNFVTDSTVKNRFALRLGIAANVLSNKNYFQFGATIILSFAHYSLYPTVGLILRKGINL